ncbi:MAG: poly-gamma-glutamate synthase PgsB [Deltaproteobacteria bacterium]|nr:poly-gamma-glutamate synthase PgsB [Deltaproteobacteria bacterium]
MLIVAIMVGLLIAIGIWEYQLHLRNLRKIPVRVHVNGTRGKSSVTRLIAAGLRAGGIVTCAKTTGSRPRMILEDGSEYAIQRQGRANVLEQLRAVAVAARRGAKAVVVECMALSPALQQLSERKMVHSSVGIITNIRADHLDVMGPTVVDAAKAMAGTVPRAGPMLTAENDPELLGILQQAVARNGVELIICTPDDQNITEEIMRNFSYIEHPENVAMAVKCCSIAGIDREKALEGMYQAEPDIGALIIMRLAFFAKNIDFVNAFAANDPDSTKLIWKRVDGLFPGERNRVALLNCRSDRAARSAQLGSVLSQLEGMNIALLTGSGTRVALEAALKAGLHTEKIIVMENPRPEDVFERVIAQIKKNGTVFGMGNIGSGGSAIVEYFQNRAVH